MKDYYTISEISKHGIGTWILVIMKLNFHEPRGKNNNLSLYRLKDICRLNAIRDFTSARLFYETGRAYLDDESGNTLCMLEDERKHPGIAGTAEVCGKIHRENGAHSKIRGNGRIFIVYVVPTDCLRLVEECEDEG